MGRASRCSITRAQAIRAADAYLRQRQVDPERYHQVAWVRENVDPLAVRYLLEHKSIKESDQIYRLATRLAVLEVRYFRPLEKDEHHVFLDPTTGQVFGYRVLLDDNAPGASLSPEQAQTLAAKYVEEQGYHLSDFDLQNSEAEKRKAREDYTLVWQAKAGDPRNVADAHYRLEVEVAGDQVVGFARSFKLPEAWERARRSSSLVNSVLSFAGILVGLALGRSRRGLVGHADQVRPNALAPGSESGRSDPCVDDSFRDQPMANFGPPVCDLHPSIHLAAVRGGQPGRGSVAGRSALLVAGGSRSEPVSGGLESLERQLPGACGGEMRQCALCWFWPPGRA